MDMPECILQHISRFITVRQWAIGPSRACHVLNRLPLPVMQVRSGCRAVLFYICAELYDEVTCDPFKPAGFPSKVGMNRTSFAAVPFSWRKLDTTFSLDSATLKRDLLCGR